jgi:hypothetical protein
LQVGPTKGKQQLFNFLPEIKYTSYILATKEAIWLGQLLFDLVKKQIESLIIHGDNQSVIALVENLKFHLHFKHMELHFHFIQTKISFGKIQLKYQFIDNMVVDILIKSLLREKHEYCIMKVVFFSHNYLK